MALVRVTARCNQRCRFCNVNFATETSGDLTAAQVRDMVTGRLFHPEESVELSGGEPTLNPELPAIVNELRDFEGLTLQTNGLLLARGDLAKRLHKAGLRRALVSLHAADAAVSDALTGAPGSFLKTLQGIDALRNAGIRISLNTVVNRHNHRDLPAIVELAVGRFGRRIHLVFSFMAPYGQAATNFDDLVFPLAEALPFLAEAIERAASRGVKLRIPDVCGLPPCLVPAHPEVFDLLELVLKGWPVTRTGKKIKGPHCGQCGFNPWCEGLWEPYGAVFDVSRLAPLRRSVRDIARQALPLGERLRLRVW